MYLMLSDMDKEHRHYQLKHLMQGIQYQGIASYSILHPLFLFFFWSFSLTCATTLPCKVVSDPITNPCYLTFACILVCIWMGVDICISWADSSDPVLSWALRPRCTDDSLALSLQGSHILEKSWMGGRQLFTCQSKQCKEILLQA